MTTSSTCSLGSDQWASHLLVDFWCSVIVIQPLLLLPILHALLRLLLLPVLVFRLASMRLRVTCHMNKIGYNKSKKRCRAKDWMAFFCGYRSPGNGHCFLKKAHHGSSATLAWAPPLQKSSLENLHSRRLTSRASIIPLGLARAWFSFCTMSLNSGENHVCLKPPVTVANVFSTKKKPGGTTRTCPGPIVA